VQCPNCQTEVSRGTAICPACDEILDASVFDPQAGQLDSFEDKTSEANLDELHGAPAPAKPPPPPKAAFSSAPKAVGPPAAKLGGDPRKVALAAATPPQPQPQKGKPNRRRWSRPTTSADEVLTDGWAAFRSLPVFEQFSIVSLLIGSIALLFPWRMNDTGAEDIGIFAMPIALLPLLGAIGAAILRLSIDQRSLRADQLATIQLTCGIALLAICAYFFYEAFDVQVGRGMLREIRQATTYPEVGCVACGLAALGIAASGAWAYLEERGYE
jgi:hypothetical protein